jgi:hypothetical protein
MMEPQYVLGAATRVGTRIQKSRQDTRPTDDCAGVHTAEKNSKKPLSGAVCLLTRRGLISVRRSSPVLPMCSVDFPLPETMPSTHLLRLTSTRSSCLLPGRAARHRRRHPGRFRPSHAQRARPMISSLSFADSHGSSSVNIVTHCRHEIGMRVMSVPQNMRSGPKAS